MSILAVTLAQDGAATVGLATELLMLKEMVFLIGDIFGLDASGSPSLLCDGVFSGSCLTHVSDTGDSPHCSDRIGFILSGSSSFSSPRIFTALAAAAFRSSLSSSRLKLTECSEDPDLERLLTLLGGDPEIWHLN